MLVPCENCKALYPRKNIQTYASLRIPETIDLFFHQYICSNCIDIVLDRHKINCIACNGKFLHYDPYRVKLCKDCSTNTKIYEEYARLRNNIKRSEQANATTTLTLYQWLTTLAYFEWKCAYCLLPFKGLEHYLPLSLGGGTTQDNCLPSCPRCNTTKRDKPPNEFTRLFPSENIARIQAYFSSL